MDSPHTYLPLLGIVKAGFPTFEEQANNSLSLEEYLIENIHASFMTKMQNNNLSPIGILKGDLVIIERRTKVNVNEIVLVLLDGHHIFLQAEMNNGKIALKSVLDKKPRTEMMEVVGVVKGVIRKY